MTGCMVPTIRRSLDYRTHWALIGGWQIVTLCGRRGNWLHGLQPVDPGTGIIDYAECLEEWRNDRTALQPGQAGEPAR